FDGKGDTAYELYDYQTDPNETKNLVSDHPEVVQRLTKILSKYPAPSKRNR
ncbi:iduronate-2-sulfatase, partial [Rhodopirellula europaea 6C]